MTASEPNKVTPTSSPSAPVCGDDCSPSSDIEALNRTCYCIGVDQAALREALEIELGEHGLVAELATTHPHLFASLPVFIAPHHLERMARVIDAVESVVAVAAYQQTVLARAPAVAGFDSGTRGGLLSFDFHLTNTGPQLIEINTNPGGAFLNTVLARAQRACCAEVAAMANVPRGPADTEQALLDVFASEWRLQRGGAAMRSVAIVDSEPEKQYLYPEFLLVRQLFRRRGIDAVICDPRELVANAGQLWHRETAIDLIYNRLTDFSLELPAHESIKSVYLAGEVVLTPHPRAHALYADKRNLALLSDSTFLRSIGVSDAVAANLLASIPHTTAVTADNREALWANRRRLFFKPAAGYGSKAAYRGDKLTKRVWSEITAGSYVAQTLVVPSKRRTMQAGSLAELKVDVRNYAYGREVKMVAARLYEGQTTNFRTAGGGFAPVLTSRESRVGDVPRESAGLV